MAFIGHSTIWEDFQKENTLEKQHHQIVVIVSYLTNGGATTSYAVRGELNFNHEKEKAEKYLLAIQNRNSFDKMVR